MRMNSRIALMVLAAALASNDAYGKKFPLTATAAVPAARGTIDTGKDKNGNTKLEEIAGVCDWAPDWVAPQKACEATKSIL